MRNAMSHREPSVLKDGLHFPEGPRWREGALYFSDILAGTVHRLDLDRNMETIAEVAELPSGLGWLPDGTLQVVSLHDGRLLACRDGHTAVIAEMRQMTGFSCNDMVIDRAGRAYVGSPDTDFDEEQLPMPGNMPRLSSIVLVAPPAPGAAWDARRPAAGAHRRRPRHLSQRHGGNPRWRHPDRGRDLRSTPDRVRHQTRRGARQPAGVGGPWRTAGRHRPGPRRLRVGRRPLLPLRRESGGYLRIAEGGALRERIDAPGYSAYACTLGGQDGTTLFLCESAVLGRACNPGDGRIRTVEVDVPGVGTP